MTDAPEPKAAAPRRRRKLWWTVGIVAGLFLLYTLIGFFGLPWWIKTYGARMLGEVIRRPVTIAGAAFNPFKFTLGLDGISIQESDGSNLVAVARIFADLDPAAYLGGTATVRTVEIDGPQVHVTRLADGGLNLAKLAPPAAPETSPEKEKAEPVEFLLSAFELRQGQVVFRDETVGGFETTVTPLSLKVTHLTNRPGETGAYDLAFQTAAGENLTLKGSLGLAGALATEGRLALSGVPLAHYAPYYRDHVGFPQAGGRVDVGLAYRWADGQALIEDLSLTLADLALPHPTGQHTFLALSKLSVSGGRVDTRNRTVVVKDVGLEGLTVTARQNADGRIDVVDLLAPPAPGAEKAQETPPASEAAAGASGGGWTVKVEKVGLGAGPLRFEAPEAAEPLQAGLEALTVQVADIGVGSAGTTIGQAGLALEHLSLARHYKAPSIFRPATVGLEALTVEAADIGLGAEGATLGQAGLTLRNLALADPAGKTPLVQVPQITVSEASLDSAQRTASVAEIAVTGTRVSALRRADGTVNLADLFAAPAGAPSKAKSGTASQAKSAAPAPDKDAAPAWTFRLGALVLKDQALAFKDLVPEPDVQIAVDDLALTVKDFSTADAARPKIDLNCRINKAGSLSVGGDVQLDPLTSELAVAVKDLPIQPFQPYFSDQVGLIVTDGRVGVKGRLSLALPEGGAPRIHYRGGAGITRFASADKRQGKDFLRWKSLFVENADIATEPMAVRVGKVALSDYYARVIVNADGTLNATEIFAPPDKAEAEAAKPAQKPAPKATPKPTPAAKKPAPPPIRIDEVTLQGGQVDFADFLAKPNFETRMVNLGGRVSGLSTDAAKHADVLIQGALENQSPLEIAGRINPLAQDPFIDLKLTFRNIEMSPFSPYSGKYLGYTLAKGKLNLELAYTIAERKLKAQNRIYFDALTLGDRVDSPDATSLPIQLALALLTDRQGRIELDVPVQGDLDDPEFSIFGIVIKALVNLLTKIITSPFDALASLFDGQVVTHLDFEPGSAAAGQDAPEQIAKLADALDSRPALKLEITGKADPQTDEPAIRQQRFDELLRATKLRGAAGKGQESLDSIQIDPGERPEIIARAYAAADFPKPKEESGKEKVLPPEEMEKLLFTQIAISDNDLRRLANERATAVRDLLLADQRVGADRVFLLEPKVEKAEEKDAGRRVQFSLR